MPAKGMGARWPPSGVVVVVPELQGNSEAEFYAEMYVDDIYAEFVRVEARVGS